MSEVMEQDLSGLPITVAPFGYAGCPPKFAGFPGDIAIEDMRYQHPTPFENRGRLYRDASRNGCLIEVGAHIGTTTVFAAPFFVECHAFEPSSRNFSLLKHNLKLNGVMNVACERCAFSNRPSQSELFLCQDQKSACHSLNAAVAAKVVGKESVDVRTLDARFALNKNCTMLLVDAEGYDMKVLQGGKEFVSRQGQPPLIVIEFAPKFWAMCGSTAEELVGFVKQMGYRCFADFGNNFSPVSPAALIELFAIWKDCCQAWLDLYLVERGAFQKIFPNRGGQMTGWERP
jgi:FkbM family methyltransferase